MTKTDARAALDRFSAAPLPRPVCEHGHPDCSATQGGPCLDDVIRAAVDPDAPDPVLTP